MRNEIVVNKLLAYAEKISRYCEGYSYDAFVADTKLVEACVLISAKWVNSAKVLMQITP